jgi:hypothetical protein
MAFSRVGALGVGFGRLGGLGTGGVTAAGVAPVLSVASAADFSDIFVWGQATTDTASGTLYAVVVAGAASTPTAAQIVAGTDAAGAAAPNGSVAVSSTGAKQVLVRGLTAVTAYKVCMTHRAASSNSNVVTGSFTTDTLVRAFAIDGTGTNMVASTGSAAFGLNQADPLGGTNAVRWVDSNDSVTGGVLANLNATFFNGVNKLHITLKAQGGGAHLQISTAAITVLAIPTWWNTTTGVIGSNNAAWTPTPVTFDLGSGWWMWSGQANLAGADVAGSFTLNMGSTNGTATVSRNGTNIKDLYNIRITRV